MRRISGHLTYANVMVTLLAFVVLAGGVAYAANTVFSTDIVNGEVKSVDIGTNEVRSADVRNDNLSGGGLGSVDIANDSLSGLDIAEPTLQNVDASRIGGLQVRKINFRVLFGTGPTTVLDLAGLQITAECQNFGDRLDVKAFTSKDSANAFYLGSTVVGANDTDAFRDIDSAAAGDRSFDIGEHLDIDNATPVNGDNSIGRLDYSAPDLSVVVVDLAFDEFNAGCLLTGTAIGG